MPELTVSQLIKLIIGALVVVAVILGIYFIFKERILEFFQNLPAGSPNFWRAFI